MQIHKLFFFSFLFFLHKYKGNFSSVNSIFQGCFHLKFNKVHLMSHPILFFNIVNFFWLKIYIEKKMTGCISLPLRRDEKSRFVFRTKIVQRSPIKISVSFKENFEVKTRFPADTQLKDFNVRSFDISLLSTRWRIAKWKSGHVLCLLVSNKSKFNNLLRQWFFSH